MFQILRQLWIQCVEPGKILLETEDLHHLVDEHNKVIVTDDSRQKYPLSTLASEEQFKKLYRHLVEGELEQAATIRDFYDEYLAVNDLPAEFYLETVERVFQTYDLPRGELTVGERRVNPAAIRRTALMTVEGERDDICAVGQTVAAQDLCTSVRPYLKTHHLQAGVGHYGVFSGSKWNTQIYPRVREMIHTAQVLH